MRVTRRLRFSAAHRLRNQAWSDERNRSVFGDCSNPEWHGHNYGLEVTVAGPVDPGTGYVIDLKLLDELVRTRVIDHLDHRNLNTQVEWLADTNPTTENLAVAIWTRLADHLPDSVDLVRVLVRETERNSAEFTGQGLDPRPSRSQADRRTCDPGSPLPSESK